MNKNTSNFIELIKNWFSVVNVAHPNDNATAFKSPYEALLKKPESLLNRVHEKINTIICQGKIINIFSKKFLLCILMELVIF